MLANWSSRQSKRLHADADDDAVVGVAVIAIGSAAFAAATVAPVVAAIATIQIFIYYSFILPINKIIVSSPYQIVVNGDHLILLQRQHLLLLLLLCRCCCCCRRGCCGRCLFAIVFIGGLHFWPIANGSALQNFRGVGDSACTACVALLVDKTPEILQNLPN